MPLFTPCVVVRGHVRDESLHLNRSTGASSLTGLQAPEEAKEISMLPHERIRPHNRQEFAPVDELRKQDECDSGGVVRAARSDLAFDVTGELLPEEQVLGCQLRAGPEHQTREAQQVSEEGERRSKHVWR